MKLPLTLIALAFFSTSSKANLCEYATQGVPSIYQQEASALNIETFDEPMPNKDPANVNLIGLTSYNALILGCNRKRDSNQAAIEATFMPQNKPKIFAQDLAPRIIEGRIRYLGAYPFRYNYMLERKAGKWIVTSFLKMNFSNDFPGTIDISTELAQKLRDPRSRGKNLMQTVCAPGNIQYVAGKTATDGRGGEKNSNVARGLLYEKDSKTDFDRAGCRLGENDQYALLEGNPLQTKSLKHRVYDFWKESLHRKWTRNGYETQILILGYDIIDRTLKRRIEDDKAYWDINLHNKADAGYSYIEVFSGRGIFEGANAAGIAHEYGHSIGLDDEYREGKNKDDREERRECDTYRQGHVYIMCHDYGNASSVKAVYPWLITRRYDAGKRL